MASEQWAFPWELIRQHQPLFDHFAVRNSNRGAKVIPLLDEQLADEEYRLEIKPDAVILSHSSRRGLFYALATLLQIFAFFRPQKRIPALSIRDFPQLPFRAFMLDISRGAVPRLETLKDLILKLSLLKMNHFSLYIEDPTLIEDKNYPAMKRSVLTRAELTQLINFARQLQVEVFPSLQSLCHLKNLLRYPGFGRFAAAGGDCIDPRRPEAVEFIETKSAEIAALFPSHLVNIGMDECEPLGSATDYLGHFLHVYHFFRSQGKTVMAWADMFQKYPDTIKKIPGDVWLLNWDYASETKEEFLKKSAPFKRHHLSQVLCPGTWSWAKYIPSGQKSRRNIAAAYQAAKQDKLKGVMLASWGDDGNEYLLEGIALALFSAGSFLWRGEEARPSAFAWWLEKSTDLDLFRLFLFLSQVDEPLPYTHRYYLFEDPLFAPFSKLRDGDEVIARYRKAAAYLQKRGRSTGAGSGFVEFARHLYQLLADKVAFSQELARLLEQKQTAEIERRAADLAARLEELKQRYFQLWIDEYKPEGLFENLAKLTRIQERWRYLRSLVGNGELSTALLLRLRNYAVDQPRSSIDANDVFGQ